MNILAIDPSGNHSSAKEGSGTSGIAYRLNGKLHLTDIRASSYESTEDYWNDILQLIRNQDWDHIVFEGYRLYNHAGMAARTQTNSTLQTSQLIGAIRMEAWRRDIPYTIQYAVEVKGRWTDKILQAKGYLEEGNKFNGKKTNDHCRDALRHLVHFETYKLGGIEMTLKAFDIDGTEIKRGDIVKMIEVPKYTNHAWLRVGNTLKVGYWEDRSLGSKKDHIILFLKSKTGGRYCQMGIQDRNVRVIKSEEDGK